jgi:Helix-turn-helix
MLRQALRMSVRAFAEHLGVSARMVSKWEAGAVPRPVNQAALDTALTRGGHDVRSRFADACVSNHGCVSDDGYVSNDGRTNGAQWMVQLPVRAPNLAAALTLAETAAVAVAHLPQIVTDDVTVSTRAAPVERFRVFCDKVLSGDRPCAGRHGHDDPCSATLTSR